jgi:multimeric flavodoxin WrbA
MKKIIGLSCGRKNSNCEFLLKEAAMGAEELGVEMEIIQAMQLKVLPCRGCEACYKTGKCVSGDDVEWILEKIFNEDCGVIVAVPVYHLRSNSLFMSIAEKTLHFHIRNKNIPQKTRVGGIISVANSDRDWTNLNLSTINIFMQQIRLVVDQIEVNRALLKGSVLRLDRSLKRARELGRNVARAMSLPVEEVKYLGEETPVSCPVCHCNILQVPADFPNVVCPVCWVRGIITIEQDKMKVHWNQDDIKHPRFSNEGNKQHLDWVAAERIPVEKQFLLTREAQEMIKKYSTYGKIIKP